MPQEQENEEETMSKAKINFKTLAYNTSCVIFGGVVGYVGMHMLLALIGVN